MKTEHEIYEKGNSVQCINSNFIQLSETLKLILKLPVAQKIYTVRGIDAANNGIWLIEIKNEILQFPNGNIGEPSFDYSRFKLVAGPKRNINEFSDDQIFPEPWLTARVAQDQDIRIWFSKLSENQKLSLFHKRINTDEETPYDELLHSWWINRY
jgi:hypothetical protein